MKAKTKKRITFEDLNTREQAVVEFLTVRDAKGAGLKEIAVACFDRKKGASIKAVSYFRANSWARNAVRRPMREGLIERVGDPGKGTYRATRRGRSVVAR